MATELPQSLRDEFARLAAMPGENAVLTDETPTPDSSAPTTKTATAEPKLPAPTKPTPTPAKQPVNLDDFEEFRKYKSERDRKEAELQQRLAEHQRQLEAQQQAESQARLDALNERMAQTMDDGERMRLIDEAAALRGRAYYEQWQRWENHKRQRIVDEGLDTNDARFQKQYSGEPGALEFERDLLAAAKERYQREAAELKAHISSTNIQELVRKELAKLAQAQGLNYTDTGDGSAPGEPDVEQAMADFNQGRINFAEFKRRTGGR